MIQITVDGLEKLDSLIVQLDKQQFIAAISNIIGNELDILYKKIEMDPDIPDTYKKAMFISVNTSTGMAMLSVFIKEEYQWIKWGKLLSWQNYKCPIRKYAGGELAPEYTGPSYIKDLFEKEKVNIKNNIRAKTVTYIRSVIKQ